MKAAATGRFLLVLMACSVHAVTCSSSNTTPGNQTDRLSLLEFKNSISLDPQQALASWNDSTHFCNWDGVTCRTTSNRVTNLDFGNRGLVGQISPSLGNLTFVKQLSLATNRFSGQIPAALGQLHRLQTLYLSNNTLHAVIPTFGNCSNLEILWLNGNNLLGGFPDLPLGLKQLELGSNNLSGTIPPSLANITTLKGLGFNYNNIEGNFPHEFAKFPELQRLLTSANHLVGSFPQAILNLSTLVSFRIAMNDLSGEVPPGLGSSLPNLQILLMDYNFFHGHIPSSLANASDLRMIDMSNNSFTGVIPSSIGKLGNLYGLNLELNKHKARNNQDWEFIYSLGNCSKLQGLSVFDNQLEGHVPTSLGNLSVELQILLLGNNQLSGGFPSGIANLRNLMWLGLGGNQFTGKVPEWLGTLNSLQVMILGNNNFTGFIPSYLMNLTQLSDLGLQANKFEGHVPTSIGVLQNLQEDILPCIKENSSKTKPWWLSKFFALETWGAQKSFIAECNALRKVRHRNLVPILTACSSIDSNGNDFKALVYEFMTQECAAGGAVSSAGDVYSFGIVLLEIFLRRRPTDDMFNGEMNITKFVEINFPDWIPQIIDPELLVEQQHLCPETSVAMKEKSLECLLSVLNIGLLCTKPSPNERICMQEVTARLHGIKKAYIS
ncbi:unnamed protein product [Miscanthus lutarioriparius]|uniref:Leucine-rich repeat-containing N-terminal plant-type domain-containing protein n=1 Tax=Miscanthus lutarioriparius TaxID=422564 RepID=A0A811SIM2_9POAL|nr:unnamed protein product [Miscanthus lutarioriparius]